MMHETPLHAGTRTLHAAEILLTMEDDPLMAGAGVVVDGTGTIVEVAHLGSIRSGYDRRVDHALLMPGVLNCHTHLTDASIETPVPGGDGLNPWVQRLIARRQETNGFTSGSGSHPNTTSASGDRAADLHAAVLSVLETMRAGGTVAIGEVCNTLDTLAPIERSGMRCRFIHELIAFRADRAGHVMSGADDARTTRFADSPVAYALGAHAPYSVSPALMELIVERSRGLGTRVYEHLAEDPAERELYENGSGPWRDYLVSIGAWEPSWRPPGISPIEQYDRMGVLDARFVAVHLANAREDELRLLAARGVHAILSPTSNLHITGLLPRLDTIAALGLPFALGTDGRGSNPSVDVFDEASLLYERWEDVRPGLLLRALTTVGAAVLGFDDLGRIRVDSRPGLISIDIEHPTSDLRSIERQILDRSARRRAV